METALLVTSLAAGVGSAVGGIAQGVQSKQAATLERQQYETEGRIAALAGAQQEIAARKRYEGTVAMNETLRASRGLTFESGSARALSDANLEAFEDDISTMRLNTAGRVSKAGFGASGATMRGQAGLFSGISSAVSGLGTVATAGMRYFPTKAK